MHAREPAPPNLRLRRCARPPPPPPSPGLALPRPLLPPVGAPIPHLSRLRYAPPPDLARFGRTAAVKCRTAPFTNTVNSCAGPPAALAATGAAADAEQNEDDRDQCSGRGQRSLQYRHAGYVEQIDRIVVRRLPARRLALSRFGRGRRLMPGRPQWRHVGQVLPRILLVGPRVLARGRPVAVHRGGRASGVTHLCRAGLAGAGRLSPGIGTGPRSTAVTGRQG